ncbi:MAG: aldo/keto reductase [Planctomycetes bacterium]|nr:aldo/keto reductase [Planctomycetota bacterium]
MSERKITRREFVKESTIAAAGLAAAAAAAHAGQADTRKVLNYNPNMEYRPCGKTGLTVSAVAMGGHWKRIEEVVPGLTGKSWLAYNIDDPGFQKNRYEVVTKCMEVGINWIDACTIQEVMAYSKALKGRRDKMYLACSWYQNELRNASFRTEKALLETLDKGMKDAGLDYVDLWRITMHEQSVKHTDGEVEEMMKALEAARKSGKVRFTGFSSHHREHIRGMIEKYPTIVDAFCTPYTFKTIEKPQDSMFDAVRKHQVGVFGIKPFGGNSLFKGGASQGNATAKDHDDLARLAIRTILTNKSLTAPIPGMISTQQVDNIVKAVKEPRQLSAAERERFSKAAEQAWASLPQEYCWLKDWEYV